MRLDLVLYGVAIVLFALTAIVFFAVLPEEGQLVYAVSTLVLALLMVATGYVVRPKPQAPAQVQPVITPTTPAAEPIQQAGPVENPVVPTSNVDTPVVEAPPPQPKAETQPPTLEVPTPAPPEKAEPVVPTPVLTAPEPAPILSAPAETPALAEVFPAPVSECTSIRGISAKRAEQLREFGINCIQDLAKASPEELAAKLEVSPKIVKMWVGSAKKQAK